MYQPKSLVFSGFENSEELYLMNAKDGGLIHSLKISVTTFRLTSICSI